jgi:hypothetical protein
MWSGYEKGLWEALAGEPRSKQLITYIETSDDDFFNTLVNFATLPISPNRGPYMRNFFR